MEDNREVPHDDGTVQAEMDIEAPRELIARARHDRAAFGQLYDLYLPRVYGFCRRYSRTREEAEDLTAESFVRALAAMPGYQDRNLPFSRWLLRIAHNVILNHARSRRPETGERDAVEIDSGENLIDDWEHAYWLRSHLETLPTDQQEVVRLRFFEDHQFREVADRMGRSEGAVKQLLRRALQVLNLRIQAEVEESAIVE